MIKYAEPQFFKKYLGFYVKPNYKLHLISGFFFGLAPIIGKFVKPENVPWPWPIIALMCIGLFLSIGLLYPWFPTIFPSEVQITKNGIGIKRISCAFPFMTVNVLHFPYSKFDKIIVEKIEDKKCLHLIKGNVLIARFGLSEKITLEKINDFFIKHSIQVKIE